MYATITKHKNIVVETFYINIVLLLIFNHSYKKECTAYGRLALDSFPNRNLGVIYSLTKLIQNHIFQVFTYGTVKHRLNY